MSDLKIKKIIDCKSALMIGERGSGKTSICIRYSTIDVENGKSVYFTSDSRQVVISKLKEFNLNADQNGEWKFKIFESPKIRNNNGHSFSDEIYSSIILGITDIIKLHKPDRIVFDELTDYAGFSDLSIMERTVSDLVRFLNSNNIQNLFTLSEPVSERAFLISEILKRQFPFHISLSKNPFFVN